MDCQPAPEPADPTHRLTREVYYVAVHTLRGALPAPETDTPEAITRRDHAAIAQVAAMLPANADEVFLAANCVAARLYGMDCLRQAREFDAATDQMWAHKCAAQGNSMMRESRQSRSLLMRLQAAREKREADPVATDRAAWSEHCTIGLMTGALAGPPADVPVPAKTAPATPEPPPASEPPADEAPPRDLAAEADLYAILYPRRATLIRALGRLPDNPNFGPPDPELVPFIAHGTTPALLALDAEARQEVAATA